MTWVVGAAAALFAVWCLAWTLVDVRAVGPRQWARSTWDEHGGAIVVVLAITACLAFVAAVANDWI